MKINVKFKGVPKANIDKATNLALFAMQEQVRTDTNYFVKVDTGILRDSINSEVDGNVLTVSWDTPYAKKQYYTGKPSTDKNPNASIMWAHKAAAAHGKDWAKMIQKGIADNL